MRRKSCLHALHDHTRSAQAEFLRDCRVPRLKGKSLKKAKRAIKSHDCRLGKIRRAMSTRVRKGHVISQKPEPGRQLPHGAEIRLVLSKGKR